jgi:hypothetical protein
MAKFLITLAVLAGFGLLRWPFEAAATAEFRARGLLPPQAGLALRERLTQNSYAGVLGGARSFVASIENLRAFTAWENRDYGQVESKFRLITDLQPRVGLYWETAAYNMAYLASGYYRYDWDGPGEEVNPAALEALKLELWTRYIRKGHEFLEDGLRNVPANWQLASFAGMLYGDPHKLADQARSAHWYAHAARQPGAPPRLRRLAAYPLSLVPGREEEARKLLQELYDEGEHNHLPNLLGTLLDLQLAAGLPPESRVPLEKIGASDAGIQRELHDYALARRHRGGDVSAPLLALIRRLEASLEIPAAERLPDRGENS